MIYLTQIYVIRVCAFFHSLTRAREAVGLFELGVHGGEQMNSAVMGMTPAINAW